jgi:hypothetical protein
VVRGAMPVAPLHANRAPAPQRPPSITYAQRRALKAERG